MRVLHVITGLDAGGAEQWLRLLLRHSAADADVLALCNAGVLAEAIRSDGVRVTDLGMRGNRDLGAIPRLVAHVRRGRYDLVHTHLYRAPVYGALAARLAGVRTVVSTEHSLNDRLIEGRPTDRAGVRGLYLAAARLTTRVVAVSEPVARRLVAWGVPAAKVTVVPVGIETAAFAFDPQARRDVRAELGIAEDTVVVGGVGRMVEPKRFDVLLRALTPLPGVAVLLVGEGPARDGLAALAAQLGMADRVRFAGRRLDVGRVLSAMDVFASTSPEETFGVAILEAMAAGLPVVYAAAPALDALPAAALAAVTRAEPTPAAFEAALRGVAGPGTDRARASAPSALLADYDGATLARRIDRIYDDCLGPAPSTSPRTGFGRGARHG
ncbi:MAG: glycosyltransferase [Pseudonocardia sp.]